MINKLFCLMLSVILSATPALAQSPSLDTFGVRNGTPMKRLIFTNPPPDAKTFLNGDLDCRWFCGGALLKIIDTGLDLVIAPNSAGPSLEYPDTNDDNLATSGKAISLVAIGQTSCFDDTLFHQRFSPTRPLWVHNQTDDRERSKQPEATPRLSQSFDTLARQGLWLETRGWSDYLLTPTSWNDFLQNLATAEIEQRFALRPGTLDKMAIGDLPQAIASARLASQLGLISLPETNTDADFYTILGKEHMEATLGLPKASLIGKEWSEIYANIGLRVLETHLGLGNIDGSSPFPATTGLSTNNRFQALRQALTDRADLYSNPNIALGLPGNDSLPNSQDSTIFVRLSNGDPTAFATAGAYFLATNLQLAPPETATFVQAIDSGQSRPPSLTSGRPLDPTIEAATFFSAGSNEKTRQALWQKIGHRQDSQLRDHLGRVNGTVLLALTGSSRQLERHELINFLTNTSERQKALESIAASSASDAGYRNDLSTSSLTRRGQEILADDLDVTITSITDLDGLTNNSIPESVEQGQSLDTIDSTLNWPKGTALTLIRNQIDPDRQKALLLTGANTIWQSLGLSNQLKSALDNLYFKNLIETPSESPDSTPDAPEEPEDDPNIDLNETFNNFSIPLSARPLADLITSETGLTINEVENLLVGRLPIIPLTLSTMAKALSANSTIVPAKLAAAYNTPSASTVQPLLDQAESLGELAVFSPFFFETLKKAGASPYVIWQTLEGEALRQWNISCPSRELEAQEAIDRLVSTVIGFSHNYETYSLESDGAQAPVQIVLFDQESLSENTRNIADDAYPVGIVESRRWGVLKNSQRTWDHLYMAY